MMTTFARMLKSGDPPNDWKELLKAVTADDQLQELVDQFTAIQGEQEA